jgi:hypothetical protein
MFVRHLMKLILFRPFSLPQEGILENEFPFAAGKRRSAGRQSHRAVNRTGLDFDMSSLQSALSARS